MKARAPASREVEARPLTLGLYLACRSILLRGVRLPEVGGVPVYVHAEPNPAACERATLIDFVDAVFPPPRLTFASDEALRAFAAETWAAIRAAYGEAAQGAYQGAERVEYFTGQFLSSGPEGDRAEPPLEHMIGCLEPPHYVALRDLPLWEGLLVLRCRSVILAKQEEDRKGGGDYG